MFFVSILGIILFTFSIFPEKVGLCKIVPSCFYTFDPIAEVIFIFVPIFILSLITYKMREEIFRAWVKFTYVWVPLTIIFTLLAPEYTNSLLPIFEKGFVSFSMSFLFLLISLIIIISKHFSLKQKV